MGKTKLRRAPRLVIGVITLLFAGVIYAWSILNAPFVGVLDAAQLGLNYTIAVIFFCLGGFFSGLLSKKVSSSLRLIISGSLLFAGFFITAHLDGSRPVLLYLSYGVLAGTGVGFVYNTVLGTVNAWFPDKQGLSSGILLSAMGFSSLIVGQAADLMGRNALIGWRMTYIIFAISIGAVLFAASLLIKLPPKDTVFPQPKGNKKANAIGGEENYPVSKMLRHSAFIKLAIFIMIAATSGSAAISFARDIAMEVGASAGFAVTVVGLLSMSNGVGRFALGWFFDNIGMRKTQWVMGILVILAPTAVMVGLFTNSLAIGLVGICLCGFTYGGGSTVGSVIISGFFGLKNFSLNFSIFNLFVLLPAPFSATLAGTIKDTTGSFIYAFMLLAVLAAAGMFVNLSIKKP